MNVPTSTLECGSTRKGIAVEIIHVYQDHMWRMRDGDKNFPPGINEEFRRKLLELTSNDALDPNDEEATLGKVGVITNPIDVDPSDIENCVEVSQGESSIDINLSELAINVEGDVEDLQDERTIGTGKVSVTTESSAKYSTAEVDNILQTSFYQALLEKLTTSGTLPIGSSNFYSAYILPSRPVGTENDVDIKKSSYKKVTKFLKAMEKKNIIKLKDQRDDTLLVGVNWESEQLGVFRPHKSIEKAANTAEKSQTPHNDTSSSNLNRIQIVEVCKPKGATAELFQSQGKSKDCTYQYKEIRDIVFDYVTLHDLTDKRNRRFVILDEQLREILANNQGELVPEKMTRDGLVQQIQKRMDTCHLVTLPSQAPRLRKGPPKYLQISEARRMGNKVVTIIRGLEEYSIDHNELIDPLKRLCASSVAVNQTVHSSKKALFEIMVQGPQTKLVKEYLVNAKGFPERYIEVIGMKNGKGKKV